MSHKYGIKIGNEQVFIPIQYIFKTKSLYAMKYLLLITAILFCCTNSYGQKDTFYLRGHVLNEEGKPVDSVRMYFTRPFFTNDGIPPDKPKCLFYTDKKGDFLMHGPKGQILADIVLEKEGYFTEIYPSTVKRDDLDHPQIKLDSPFLLRKRKDHYFSGEKVNEKLLGYPLSKVLIKLSLHQLQFQRGPNMSLRTELADSTQLWLIVWSNTDNISYKETYLKFNVIGIGVAFPDGRKKFYGETTDYSSVVFNQYYEEKQLKNNH